MAFFSGKRPFTAEGSVSFLLEVYSVFLFALALLIYRSVVMRFLPPFQGAECKENFSYLPPNQRSRKLRQKVNAIKKTLAKECSERSVNSLVLRHWLENDTTHMYIH